MQEAETGRGDLKNFVRSVRPLMGWTGGFPSPLWSGSIARSHPMPAHTKTAKSDAQIAVIGIDIGKHVFQMLPQSR
jgi:hypothetical protein